MTLSSNIVRLRKRLIVQGERLADALTSPTTGGRAVLAFLAAYAALWTLYGVIAKSTQDIHFDMGEMVIWSMHPAWGTSKHPPFGSWVTWLWFSLFPYADWAFYLLAVVLATLALWFAWLAMGPYLSREKRVVGLLLLTFVPFFNFHALKFNANTILVPLWAATTLCFLRAFETRRTGWAVLAGLCAAAAMLAKYWSFFLLVGLAIAALLDRRRMEFLRSPAPWIITAVSLAAFFPHLLWLGAHGATAMRYALTAHVVTELQALGSAAGYLLGSVAYVAIPLLLVLTVIRPNWTAIRGMVRPTDSPHRLASYAFFLPLLLPVLVAPPLQTQLTALWSMPAWTLLPVILLATPAIALTRRTTAIIAAAALVLPLGMVMIAPAIALVTHLTASPETARHAHLLARPVQEEWRKHTDAPLELVGGQANVAYNLPFYMGTKTEALPDFVWMLNPADAREKIRKTGIAIVCSLQRPLCLTAADFLGFPAFRTEVDATRTYLGMLGRTDRYAIIVVPPGSAP